MYCFGSNRVIHSIKQIQLTYGHSDLPHSTLHTKTMVHYHYPWTWNYTERTGWIGCLYRNCRRPHACNNWYLGLCHFKNFWTEELTGSVGSQLFGHTLIIWPHILLGKEWVDNLRRNLDGTKLPLLATHDATDQDGPKRKVPYNIHIWSSIANTRYWRLFAHWSWIVIPKPICTLTGMEFPPKKECPLCSLAIIVPMSRNGTPSTSSIQFAIRQKGYIVVEATVRKPRNRNAEMAGSQKPMWSWICFLLSAIRNYNLANAHSWRGHFGKGISDSWRLRHLSPEVIKIERKWVGSVATECCDNPSYALHSKQG